MQYKGMKDAFSTLIQMQGKDAFKDKKFIISAFRDLTADHVEDWFLVKQVYYLNEMTVFHLVDALNKKKDVKNALQKATLELQKNFISEDGIRKFLEALLDVYGASAEKKNITIPKQLVVFRKEKLTPAFKSLFGQIDEWASNEEITGVFLDIAPELHTPEGQFFKIVLDISEGKFRTLMKTLADRQDANLALFEVRSVLERSCLEKKYIDIFLDAVWEVYFPPAPKPVKPAKNASSNQKQSATGTTQSGSSNTQNTQSKTSQQGGSVSSTVQQKVSQQSNMQQTATTNKSTQSASAAGQTTSTSYTTTKKKKKGGCIKILLIIFLITNIPTVLVGLLNKFEDWKDAREDARMEQMMEEEEFDASDIGMAEEEPAEPTATPEPTFTPTPTVPPSAEDYVLWGTYPEGSSYSEYTSETIEDTDISIEAVSAPDYSVVTDAENYNYFLGEKFTFAYPKNLYNMADFTGAHAGDNVLVEFASPDGSYLSYAMDASYNKVTEDNAASLTQRALSDMINATVLVESFDTSNGVMRYYVKGQDASNPNLTVVKTINWGPSIMIYRMVLKYPTPTDDQDRLYKEYYEEFLYRRCAFTQSTSDARLYEDFLAAKS